MKKYVLPILFRLIILSGVVLGPGLFGSVSYAASCSSRAASLAASKGGSVLSVKTSGADCIIKLLIKSASGPPKRKTFVVSK
jgi:hypothetical protein